MEGDRNLSRRDFFRGLRGLRPSRAPRPTAASPVEPPVPRVRSGAFPVHRPPRAIEETRFLHDCTRCGECITACPHDAIDVASRQLRDAVRTPVIAAMRSPCRMCDDPMPCVAACEPRVLHPALPARMATVTIQAWACLAHQGTFCTTCSEQCPVPGALTVEEGKPILDADRCTGCGVCQFVCPAPANAVLLMPVAARPDPPSAGGP